MPGSIYPEWRYVTGITNAQNAVITFSEEHEFTDGEIISLRVDRPYGMWEANQKQVRVLAHDSTTVTVELDTSNFTPFVFPIDEALAMTTTPPHAVPSSSGIIPDSYPRTINILDAFDNRNS